MLLTTNDDLTGLARDVIEGATCEARAIAGVALADAVLAHDAETAAEKLGEREALLAYHEQMRAVQQRAIDRLRLALTETEQP